MNHQDELTADLLDGEPVAGEIVDDEDAQFVRAVAIHPEVTWEVLSRQEDRDAAVRLLEYRVQETLQAGDWRSVADELALPAFHRDAAGEGDLQALALRAATAIAWHGPEEARGICRAFSKSNHSDPQVAVLSEICARVLARAADWRSFNRVVHVPDPLERFVILQWVASAALLDELIGNLKRDMTTEPDTYLNVFDAMAARYQSLLLYIVGLSERFLSDVPPSLGDLGDEERQMLVVAMEEIDAPVAESSGPRLWRNVGGALAAGALLSLGGYDAAAILATGGLGASAIGYKLWSERGLYGRMVRPRLAAYLADVGTPTSCVVSWLLQNRHAVKRIKAFDVAIDADTALAAIARLGRMARLHDSPVASN